MGKNNIHLQVARRRMRRVLKKAIKGSFNAVGLEIDRLDPSESNRFVWLKSQGIQTVFDIGANTGQFALMIHEVLPEATIYSFEPLRHCYEQLVINMRDAASFRAFNFALGDENGDSVIYKNRFSEASSLLPMNDLHKKAFPNTKRETTEKVVVRRLDEVAHGLDCYDNIMVKIDVQGYEDKVIMGGYQLMSKARLLIIETNLQILYDGAPLFAPVYDMVRRMGFEYRGAFDQLKSPIDGSVLQADSIFIK